MLRREVTCCFLACIPCLLLGCSNEEQRQGMIAANIHAIQEARRIQAALAATRKCPENLAGWQPARAGWWLETRAGTDKQQYWLSLDCQPNLHFTVAVKYSFDSGTHVYGNPEGPLAISYGHFTNSQDMKISPQEDATTIATKVVDFGES